MTPLPRTDTTAVVVQGLVKHFGGQSGVTALDGVDLTVRRGTVLGVLGPNGAGKTTLVRILSTLVRPDAGTASVDGFDVTRSPRDVRRSIGLTGQYAAVDGKLSGRENLYLIGRLLDMSRTTARARADELLERFSLTGASGRQAATYSGGMRRRLDLAASVMGRPSVLFLDEPTTGLDPRTRNEVWDEVRGLAGNGTTVLLTTQYMEEAERLADELTVIDRGRVIASGPVEELKARVGGRELRIRPERTEDLGAMAAALVAAGLLDAAGPEKGAPAPEDASPECRSPGTPESGPDGPGGVLRVPLRGPEHLSALVGVLGARGFALAGLDTRLPSLDEVFLTLTGKDAARDARADEALGVNEVALV
ncbi:ATP-binding cassette domain-containing protein [Streptomyces sp. NBC_00247]|uniref:ATP-binding cassette domain-containing protein n=1 Tax=Streptomyces sp. NBC_00247 TaxID=2975689 RepID=UPI002E2D7E15|nr:ATP-binding cassette domain-containing protein [Streptomyces sp. NBC_00247]